MHKIEQTQKTHAKEGIPSLFNQLHQSSMNNYHGYNQTQLLKIFKSYNENNIKILF